MTPVPPGCVLSNIPLSLSHGNPSRREPLVSAAQTMQVLTAPLCRREEEGKGKTIPQQILGVPSPLPDPHCVDTRCQHPPWDQPGWDCSWCCTSPVPRRRRRRRRARRGRVSVSVCLCVANPLSEGRRTTLCGFPASFSPWCLTRGVPCLNSQLRSRGAPGSGGFLGFFFASLLGTPAPDPCPSVVTLISLCNLPLFIYVELCLSEFFALHWGWGGDTSNRSQRGQ